MDTKTINLRDLPVDLVRQAKAYAALRGMTLKDFVVHAISVAIQGEIPAVRDSVHSFAVSEKGNRKRKKN